MTSKLRGLHLLGLIMAPKVKVKWKYTEPADGLYDAMIRLARQFVADGEYTLVEILYVLNIPRLNLSG